MSHCVNRIDAYTYSVLSRKASSDLGDHGNADLLSIRKVSAFPKTSQTAGVSRRGENVPFLLKNYSVTSRLRLDPV